MADPPRFAAPLRSIPDSPSRVTGAEGAREGFRGSRVPRANEVQLEEPVRSDGHRFRGSLRGKAIRDGQDPRARSGASTRFADRAFRCYRPRLGAATLAA
jgi:hypothetical protein